MAHKLASGIDKSVLGLLVYENTRNSLKRMFGVE